MKQRHKLAFHMVILAVFVALVICSFGYPRQRVIFPIIIFTMAVAASLVKLLVLIKPQLEYSLDPQGIFQGIGRKSLSQIKLSPQQSVTSSAHIEGKISLPKIIVWVMGTTVVVYLFGFAIGIGLSSIVYVGVLGQGGWFRGICMMILLPVSLYLVFELALQIKIYSGLFMV